MAPDENELCRSWPCGRQSNCRHYDMLKSLPESAKAANLCHHKVLMASKNSMRILVYLVAIFLISIILNDELALCCVSVVWINLYNRLVLYFLYFMFERFTLVDKFIPDFVLTIFNDNLNLIFLLSLFF